MTATVHRFMTASSRMFLHRHTTSHPNNFLKAFLQENSWTAVYFHRNMCTKVPIDPDCKMPVYDPKKGELVYSGNLTKKVFIAKSLTLTTCTLGAIIQPYLFMHSEELSLPLMVALGGSLGFFMFFTTGIVHMLTRKYISYIYYDRKTKVFTAGRYSFFLRRKEIKYTTDHVEIPTLTGWFTTLKIKGRPFFVDDNLFKDIDVYMHMVGFDKPMEFKDF